MFVGHKRKRDVAFNDVPAQNERKRVQPKSVAKYLGRPIKLKQTSTLAVQLQCDPEVRFVNLPGERPNDVEMMDTESLPMSDQHDLKTERKGSRSRCIVNNCSNRAQDKETRKCMRHGGGARCIVDGCPNGAVEMQTRKCSRHGGGIRCIVNGCPTKARDKKTRKCTQHGGGPRCIVDGCPNGAYDKKTRKCRQHGGGARCIVDGCQNGAVEMQTRKCRQHGGGDRCIVDGCPNGASEKKTHKCGQHGGGVRCVVDGCPNGARNKKTGKCDQHGCARCIVDGCSNQARDKETCKCIQHGGGNRCIVDGCPNGATEKKTHKCRQHGGGTRCIVDGCPNGAVEKKTHKCIQHGGGYRCQGCGLFGSKSPSYVHCQYCGKIGTKRGQKEQKVVDFLTAQLPDTTMTTHDKSIGGNACLRFRPDILYDCGAWTVIVEVDEDAHRTYDSKCEQNRMQAIMETLSMRTVFIRYNPDAYKMNGQTARTMTKARLAKLLERVQLHLKQEPEELLTVEYLFYDK